MADGQAKAHMAMGMHRQRPMVAGTSLVAMAWKRSTVDLRWEAGRRCLVCQTPLVHGGPTDEIRRPLGRAGEIEASLRALTSRAHLLISAGPGLGATSLARYVGGEVARPLRLVHAHRGTRSVPLGALAPLVGSGDQPLGFDADVLARTVARLVADPAAPPLVVVDQAHELDDLSAAALTQAAQQGLTLVLTTARRSSLAPALSSLLRTDPVVAVDLGPIDDASVARLAADVLGAAVDPALVRALTRHVGGAPAAIVDVLAHARETGGVARLGSMWRLTGGLGVPRVLALRAARAVEGLAQADLTAVDLLAIGGRMRHDLLVCVAGSDALDRLHDEGLLEYRDGDLVCLADPLLRTVRLDQTARGRGQRLAQQLQQAVGELGIEDPVLDARLALHAGTVLDQARLMSGALAAWRQGEVQLAETLCRLGSDVADLPATLMLGEMLTALGRPREAETLLCGLATDDADALALARQTRVVNLAYHLDDVDTALALLDETRVALAGTRWTDELLGLRAVITLMRGFPGEALAVAQGLLERGQGRSFCQAATAAAPSLIMQARPVDAAALASRAVAERLRLGDEPVLSPAGLHAVVQAWALAEAGDFEHAEQLFQHVLAEVVSDGDREGQMWVGILHGRSLIDAGRYDEALLVFEWAATAATDVSLVPHLRWARGGALLAAAQMRDVVATRHALDALDACPPTRLGLMAPDILRARAWARVVQGDLARASGLLRQAAALAQDSGETLLEIIALHDLVRLGVPVELSRLEHLSDAGQGELTQCRSAHAVAAQSGDMGALTAVSERFESLGAVVLAAEAANQAAWVARRDGSTSRADRLRSRVVELLSRRPRASTPALDLRPNAAFLTAREREIAELASAGWPSRAIAEHLDVSVRTVDNLLQRVYRKLGVRGRAQLRSPDPSAFVQPEATPPLRADGYPFIPAQPIRRAARVTPR